MNPPESWNYGFAAGVEEEDGKKWDKKILRRLKTLRSELKKYETALFTKLHRPHLLIALDEYVEGKGLDYRKALEEYRNLCEKFDAGYLPSDYFAPEDIENIWQTAVNLYKKDFPRI